MDISKEKLTNYYTITNKLYDKGRETISFSLFFCIKENHAIVAWFKRALAVSPNKKTPNVYNKNVTCQLRK